MVNNSKKGLGIIIILLIALIAVLTVGFLKDKSISKKNKEDYEAWLFSKDSKGSKESSAPKEENKEEPVKDTKPNENKTEDLDFYGKLKEKKPVRLLILGDGLALSQGRTSENGIWDQGVASLIQNTYGSTVELKSLAQAGASSTVGLEIVKNNDISNYDLIITCYGQNDNNSAANIEQFKSNYTNILTEIKNKNPKGTILSILPSTLNTDNKYRCAIQEVANSNGSKIVDTKEAFTNSGVPEASLLNKSLPNDKGYQIYTQAIGNVIKSGIK